MPRMFHTPAWPLGLTITGVAFIAFGVFAGIDWLQFSHGAICGGGPGFVTCSEPWPDPRLPLPLLVIGSGLLIAGAFSDRGPGRTDLAATGLNVAVLVLGSGTLEVGISVFSTYVFSSSWMFYLAPVLLGTGVSLLTIGAWHWWKVRVAIR